MNLSHAVGLIGYILARGPASVQERSRSGAVSPEETQRLIEEAEGFLRKTAFVTGNGARSQATMRRLQRLIVRASPNKAELALLWALLRHVERQTK